MTTKSAQRLRTQFELAYLSWQDEIENCETSELKDMLHSFFSYGVLCELTQANKLPFISPERFSAGAPK